jgi:hypothetical protein
MSRGWCQGHRGPQAPCALPLPLCLLLLLLLLPLPRQPLPLPQPQGQWQGEEQVLPPPQLQHQRREWARNQQAPLESGHRRYHSAPQARQTRVRTRAELRGGPRAGLETAPDWHSRSHAGRDHFPLAQQHLPPQEQQRHRCHSH